MILALLIAFSKVFALILFFQFFFTGCVTCVDDVYYLETAISILDSDFFVDSFSSVYLELVRLSEGIHIGYPIWGALSIWLFGEHYFAPIVSNIFTSVLCSLVARKIVLQTLNLDKKLVNFYFIFFSLHPELISWSTVLNGKDTIVLLIHLLFILSFSYFRLAKLRKAIFILSLVVLLSLGFRFYLPFFYLAILLAFVLLKMRGLQLFVSMGAIGGLVALLYGFYVPWWNYALSLFVETFSNL